ncbi:MAG: Rod shape-determining protein MreD [Cytophagaceae bacterium]|jgi:rod shape-determining protein MreD|nr:Rod shape-determining protein MreD [Cytophagaceae bacterium]
MINDYLKYLFAFVAYVLIQVLIINNLSLGFYINPYVYILFLLILPVEIPRWFLLTLGFCTGLTVDMFMNTQGIHASASVFLAYARPFVLSGIAPRDSYEPGSLPVPSHFGFVWFFRYAAICVVVHHIFLFTVEAFSFNRLGPVVLKTILSSVFSLALIMIIRLFAGSRKKRS